MNNLISSIYDTALVTDISMIQFAAALGVSLLLGLVIAGTYMRGARYTRSFVVTLAMLPAIIAMIIIMVNGSIGTGVAVAGAFSLVRFRSAPGSAREICMIFLAMATGLMTGMGYLALAALFTVIMCLIFMIYGTLDFGAKKNAARFRTLRVVIPEDLDYTGVFDDILTEYTASSELAAVKTTNMGSMFKLTYDIELSDPSREKEMIDKIRCRNGNLEVSVSRQQTATSEL